MVPTGGWPTESPRRRNNGLVSGGMDVTMIRFWKKTFWAVVLAVPLVLAGLWLSRLDSGIDMRLAVRPQEPLRIVVTDPLCGPADPNDNLGNGRREYAPLGRFLEGVVHRPVEVSCWDGLRGNPPGEESADLIVGRESIVRAEAARRNTPVQPLARLTDDLGATDVCGVFVVRADDRARTIGDLADHTMVFGPPADPERHSQALAYLSRQGVVPVPPLKVATTCGAALQSLRQRKVDAAVISSYALPLVENPGTAPVPALRVIGRTEPQPFLTLFATSRISPVMQRTIAEALLSVRTRPALLTALRSKAGFVPWQSPSQQKKAPPAPTPPPAPTALWTDWRGPGRAGASPDVPERLPASVKVLWKRGLTGAGLAGIAATGTHVIVADKSEQKDQDIWRCLDADTGKELWTVAYPTPLTMEFTNVPRATPVIHGDFVYLLGAFGDLYCVSLQGSRIVWRRNIVQDFNAKLPAWGTCATPLVVGESLIVNPGAADASLAALNLYTGEVIWKTPGAGPAYGSLILGTFGGVRQIVGYDAESLGGWDPNTGQRLWTLLPDKKGDYNVPTPIDAGGRLLVATENNGTRLYDFEAGGRIRPVPTARTLALKPDTSTPVMIDGLVFGCFHGLFCLDLGDGLKTLYSAEGDGAFKEYTAFVAGNGRVLAATLGGELVLLKAARDAFTPISRLRVFKGTEVWSHPALVGHRLYIRSMNEICCVLLGEPK